MRRTAVFILCSGLTLAASVSCTKLDDGGTAVSGWENLPEKREEIVGEPVDTTVTEDQPEPVFRKTTDLSKWFLIRGIQPSWNDVRTPEVLDYVDICARTGINTISVDIDYTSDVGKEFARRCKEEGIDIEIQSHMMSYLLPRNLFSQYPDAFRMDADGNRNPDANACASSEDALEIISRNASTYAKRMKPTNHRYYCWLDDGGDVCHCEKCRNLSPSDQALIFENVIIKAFRKEDPEAMLAHLAYFNTLDPPVSVKPEEGIFLEFAPIDRDRYHPFSDTWVPAGYKPTNGDLLKALAENLKVFPVETAMVLEYWMDESLFCGWKPDKLVKLYWDDALFQSDLRTYASYGIRNMQCYCYYVGSDYKRLFGYPSFLEEYGNGLYEFVK